MTPTTSGLSDSEINERLARALGWECLPDYLSDWNGAQRVISEMEKRGFTSPRMEHVESGWRAGFWHDDAWYASLRHADLPHAVAQAALAALEKTP